MHKNKVNGKVYVGITSTDVKKRWLNGRGYYKNKHFNDAIKKYGWDNFEHIIIYENIPRDMACEIEKELITKHKSNNKRYGYNITSGGEHFIHSEESKRLMSEHRKGHGLHVFSDEHKRKIKEHHAGGTPKKKVICIETKVIYESINDAARKNGVSKKLISNCCRKVPHYITGAGYHWEFYKE